MDFNSKKELRKFIAEKRDAVDVDLRKQWDKAIFERFINSEYYKSVKTIFTFVSFKSEVDTHAIISQALRDKKLVAVPKIRSKEKGMEIFSIEDISKLKKGYFGIFEPAEDAPHVEAKDLDLILMPGAAFDRTGGRLGYGMGYYDRFLRKNSCNCEKIALAYSLQVLNKVPMDETDELVDGIVTEEDFIIINTVK